MLWLDKHRPNSLSEFDSRPEIRGQLENLGRQPQLPHIIIYGPSGVGKTLVAHLLLKEIFGPAVDNVKAETLSFDRTSSSSFTFSTFGSVHHTSIFASDLGLRDRQCIQLVVKQLSQQQSAAAFGLSCLTQSFKNNDSNSTPAKLPPKYRVFIIHEAQYLSFNAQASLRRTMEKFTDNARLILLTERLSAIIPPLRSRCYSLRLPAPSEPEISRILRTVATKENFKAADAVLCDKIAADVDGNLRAALIRLETMAAANKTKGEVMSTSRRTIKRMAEMIMKDQTPTALLQVREELYALMLGCIPGQTIIETLLSELLRLATSATGRRPSFEAVSKICSAGATYSESLSLGSKEIYHLEAFAAAAMAILAHDKAPSRRPG